VNKRYVQIALSMLDYQRGIPLTITKSGVQGENRTHVSRATTDRSTIELPSQNGWNKQSRPPMRRPSPYGIRIKLQYLVGADGYAPPYSPCKSDVLLLN
jgi:hypothetical protein